MKIIKETILFAWEVFKIAVIAAVIVLPIRYFVFQPFVVKGSSMEKSFHGNDYLIVDEISYRFSPPQRGDVIVFKYPKNPSQRFIKRIVGLPGETVEIKGNEVMISKDDYSWTLEESSYAYESPMPLRSIKVSLGEDEYFVLGDNRGNSYDSEDWGPLLKDYIIGRVIFRAWPAISE